MLGEKEAKQTEGWEHRTSLLCVLLSVLPDSTTDRHRTDAISNYALSHFSHNIQCTQWLCCCSDSFLGSFSPLFPVSSFSCMFLDSVCFFFLCWFCVPLPVCFFFSPLLLSTSSVSDRLNVSLLLLLRVSSHFRYSVCVCVCIFIHYIFHSVRTFYCDARCNWSHSGCVLCSFLFFHWI